MTHSDSRMTEGEGGGPAEAGAPPASKAIVIWDIPVRIVHWMFVLLLPGLYFSYKSGNMDLHVLLGEIMFGLLLFRLLWGLVGSETARFSRFVKGPGAILAYLTGRSSGNRVGHNPLGALSVIAMLVLLSMQVGLGLFASDTDGLYSGPLDRFVSYDTSTEAAELHEEIFNFILAMVALHLAAVLYYRVFRRENLIAPMITGRRVVSDAVQPRIAGFIRFAICALLSIAAAWWVSKGLRPL